MNPYELKKENYVLAAALQLTYPGQTDIPRLLYQLSDNVLVPSKSVGTENIAQVFGGK